MKYLSYLIIFALLVVCLFMNREQFTISPSKSVANNLLSIYDQDKPGKPEIKSVEHIVPNSIKISWIKPTEPEKDKITGYIVMLKKSDNLSKGIFINFSTNINCTDNCEYTINNVPLDSEADYTIGVLAVNTKGAGLPDKKEFKTLKITSSMTINTSSPGLDSYITNMVARADGVYSFDENTLSYPDKYDVDIKNSLKTLNDSVMKDLQEYRVNVHLATV